MTVPGSSIDRRYMRLVARLPASQRPAILLEEHYGVVLDVQPVRHMPRIDTPPAPAPTAPNGAVARTRTLNPLVADLEKRLAARAGKPRSRPNYAVNVGNPAQSGDEAPVPQYGNDGVKVS